MNFNEERKKRIEYIEEILRRYLPAREGDQKIIMEAMEYSLMAGGKRLRPHADAGDIPSFRRQRKSD